MLSFKEFSKILIETGDLDPDYIFINDTANLLGLTTTQVLLWAQLKIFVYDSASEYQMMFGNKTFDDVKYGSERRKSKRTAQENYTAFCCAFNIAELPYKYEKARIYLKQFNGVGDWAAWKFCDLLERLGIVGIDFESVDFRTAYQFPLKGLCRINDLQDIQIGRLNNDETYNAFMRRAEEMLGDVYDLHAPPLYDRMINIQEVETCLCKYHSYLDGRYKPGQDLNHLIKRLNEEGIPHKLTRYEHNTRSTLHLF